MLEKLADTLETDVSTLLGEEIELKSDSNELAEQLARLNEHLAIRNKLHHKIWLAIGISLLSVIVLITGFISIRWVIGLTEKPASSDNIDFDAMSNNEYICITEFDDNSPYLHYRWETSGKAENEMLLLSSTLAEMPQEIIITVREIGNKNNNGEIILSESFKLYSLE